jgi:hypothetical protein
MIGIPVLAGLALAAAFYRSRRDPVVIHMAMLAAVALFLSTPYNRLPGQRDGPVPAVPDDPVPPRGANVVGRADRAVPDRDGGGVHPSDDVRDLRRDLAVRLRLAFLTSRFSFGSALKADGPMLMSVGFGMIAGLSCWVIGIWGSSASLAEAALPPPYTAEFFAARLASGRCRCSRS